MRVHGTKDTIGACRRHLLAEQLFPVDPQYEWCELASDSMTLQDEGQLRWTPQKHPGGSVEYRIAWSGRSLAYITDITTPGNYLEFIRGVDVLIHVCYFPDNMAEWAAKTGHSAASAAAQMAADADLGRLLLVHTDPQTCEDDPVGMESMRTVFPNTELAEDLQDGEFK